MLNKEICEKCRNNHGGYYKWNSVTENNWKVYKNIACCISRRTVYIKEDPPENCPFILEHIMKEDEKNAQ